MVSDSDGKRHPGTEGMKDRSLLWEPATTPFIRAGWYAWKSYVCPRDDFPTVDRPTGSGAENPIYEECFLLHRTPKTLPFRFRY